MTAYSSHGEFPKTLKEGEELGAAEYEAGYPLVWTPNLGPHSDNEDFIEARRKGWNAAREDAIRWLVAAKEKRLEWVDPGDGDEAA